MEVLTRTLGLVDRADNRIDPKNFVIPFIASTETTTDSHGSIILQSNLDWETRYKQNPLFAWSHPLMPECNTPTHRRALGKGIEVDKQPGFTRVLVQFAVKSNPDAKEAFEMYADGFLNACSICLGAPYAEVRRTSPEAEILALPDHARQALLEKRCEFVITRGRVLELSGCLAGSNHETLAERSAVEALDRRAEARERALCTRAQSVLDLAEQQLARITAAAEKLEQATLSPEQRELAAARAALEAFGN